MPENLETSLRECACLKPDALMLNCAASRLNAHHSLLFPHTSDVYGALLLRFLRGLFCERERPSLAGSIYAPIAVPIREIRDWRIFIELRLWRTVSLGS